MKVLKYTLFTAFLALTACKEQGGGGSSDTDGDATPPGCRLVDLPQYDVRYLKCETDAYGGSQFCCGLDETHEPYDYACWSAPYGPPGFCGGSPFDPNNPGETAADTGSGGVDDSGGYSCEASCPEPGDGTCPGHAEWDRGIMIWGVWSPNGSDGKPNYAAPGTLSQGDPVCVSSMGVCVSYSDPSDIQAYVTDMNKDQLDKCKALTKAQLGNYGLHDTAVGQYGHSLVHHFCVVGDGSVPPQKVDAVWNKPQGNGSQSFDLLGLSGQYDCLGQWQYEGYCAESSCPIETEVGTSTGGSTGEGLLDGPRDCSVFNKDNLIVNKKTHPRQVTVRGDAASMLNDDVYGTLYDCGGGFMNSRGELFEISSNSLLSKLGMVEDDKIVEVNGSRLDMLNTVVNSVDSQQPFDVTVQRGRVNVNYTVTVTTP